MAGTLFRIFLIFLGLSQLLCLKAVPITRTESLLQVPKVHDLVPENKDEVVAKDNMQWMVEPSAVSERMDLDLHDYSPYGPNTRHTPRGS
ncbi:uncharacterized protein LOC129319315 [Prosopis cineraria]|uniref:uncharacterized protein LOC129319315 n=1 Tax=Prosopis cineraria TaxID=364024 RepID=UPI0024109514|nr:uncharacterized protein LOC129319315 [Prosopis cineraria]